MGQAWARQIPVCPKRQQLRAVLGHWVDELQRTTPPVNVQIGVATQLVAPPSRLRQQTAPLAQALLSRQPMLGPEQVALAAMHIVEAGVMQQV